MDAKAQVGHNIRRCRDDLEITQEEAANRAGVHPVEFARAERGIRDMRVSTVAKIARGLNVPASELLRGI